MFSLDKLKVYDRALASTASLIQLSAGWAKRHAVVDQLVRACESVVVNIAEGARLRGIANRQHVMDYAIGSALEWPNQRRLKRAAFWTSLTGSVPWIHSSELTASRWLDRIGLLVRGLCERPNRSYSRQDRARNRQSVRQGVGQSVRPKVRRPSKMSKLQPQVLTCAFAGLSGITEPLPLNFTLNFQVSVLQSAAPATLGHLGE